MSPCWRSNRPVAGTDTGLGNILDNVGSPLIVPRPRRSERVLLRRSILISGGLHVALLLAVVLRLSLIHISEPTRRS